MCSHILMCISSIDSSTFDMPSESTHIKDRLCCMTRFKGDSKEMWGSPGTGNGIIKYKLLLRPKDGTYVYAIEGCF